MAECLYELVGRIDTTNAGELDQKLTELSETGKITLDAKKLEYISSAGLRVLLKLRKKQGELVVKNVSQEVYGIFEVTGFSDILTVQKGLRFVSVEGLRTFGAGATGAVYRIDDDTIVKVFFKGVEEKVVFRERELARKAFLAGVQTAISYDVVETEKGLGVVYEMLKAKDLTDVIREDKTKIDETVKKFAGLVREMHSISVDVNEYIPTRLTSIGFVPYLTKAGICTKEEEEMIFKIYENIPDVPKFIHGDCHLGNVMMSGDEMFFIDMSANSSGHPIFDLVTMNMAFYATPKRGLPIISHQLCDGFTNDEMYHIWYKFIETYFQTDDKKFLEEVSVQVEAVVAARIIFAGLRMKGFFPDEVYEKLKLIIREYCAGDMKPLVF